MAKIITAYVAHGHRPLRGGTRQVDFPLDADCLRQWQRIFCLFSIIRAFSDDGDCPRFLVISDHTPPVIDGRMIGFHLERLNVELHQVDHVWRPYDRMSKGEFFIFDVMELLQSKTTDDDAILIFSGRALAVNPISRLFGELEESGILCAEASYGELIEEHEYALRDRMADLRQDFDIEFPHHAMRAASCDFIGLTHARLCGLNAKLRSLFMKNFLRASRAEDHFISSSELFAALLAQEHIYRPNMAGLSDHAAAMPDDFSIASLTDVPVIIPGYGREPDIESLFNGLLGDRLEALHSVNRDTIFKLVKGEKNANYVRLLKPSFRLFRRPSAVLSFSN